MKTKKDKPEKQEGKKRNKTPSFILEIALKTTSKDKKELRSRFESARQLYNAFLREAKNRVLLIKQSKLFQKARKLSKTDPKVQAKRKELFQQAREAYDFTKYSMHEFSNKFRHTIKNKLGDHPTQKLAARAFDAVEKMLYGTAKNVRFKGYNGINSIESADNNSGIRWRNNQVEWSGLKLKAIIPKDDVVVEHGMKHKVKYCRIVRKIIRGKDYYYVQLILEGKPLIEEKNKLGKGTVAFDIGPSTIAIVAKKNDGAYEAKLLEFCSELNPREKEIRRLQRAIERQRRASNPNNYNEDGTIKKGHHEWVISKHMLRNQKQLKKVHRKLSAHRESLQGKLVNITLRMGNKFKFERVSKKWLQKLYGKSVGNKAPGMYQSRLVRKAESAGGSTMEFPPQSTKLSQICCCGRLFRKKLSERVHDCECGVLAQRDLFSAYLALFVEEVVENKEKKYVFQADQAKKCWSSADKLLQAAWETTKQSTTGGHRPSSFGTFRSLSGSSVKRGIAEFEVGDAVLATKTMAGEPQREQSVFL